MATFSVDFLGCKVSHADAQAVRERLLADGHEERAGGDVAVLNTCCVTHEALRKSRHAASRAARTHRRRVRHRLRREPLGRRVRRAAGQRRRRSRSEARRLPTAIAGDVGAIALRPGRRPTRPRPRVREGAGRLQLLLQLLRDPVRARRLAQPSRRRRARRGAPPRRPGSPRGRAHRDQPRLLQRPRGGVRPAAADPRGRRDARSRATPTVVDRGQPPDRAAPRRACARRRPSRGTCTSRSSRATTASCARWRAATTPPRTCAGSRSPRAST